MLPNFVPGVAVNAGKNLIPSTKLLSSALDGALQSMDGENWGAPWDNGPAPEFPSPPTQTQFTFWKNNQIPETNTSYQPLTTISPYQSNPVFPN